MEEDVKKAILKTVTVLEERGHCLEAFSTKDGKVCLYSAIAIATGTEPYKFPEDYAVIPPIPQLTELGVKVSTEIGKGIDAANGSYYVAGTICGYNNRHTKEEIVSFLTKMVEEPVEEPA